MGSAAQPLARRRRNRSGIRHRLVQTATFSLLLGSLMGGAPAGGADAPVMNAFEMQSLTIQERLDMAGPGGTVVLPAGEYSETGIVIGADQSLIGEGDVTIRSAGEEGDSILIAGGGGFTLTNLTLSEGRAATGGAVRLSGLGGEVTVTHVRFLRNEASDSGGAVYVGEGDRLTIEEVTFAGNSAAVQGGAIHNAGGSVSVASGRFTDNSAPAGGAVSNYGDLSIEAPATCATPTDPDAFRSSTTFANGMADDAGGAILARTGSLNVQSARFTGNTAGEGGAIYLAGGDLIIGCSVFDENTATAGGGIGAAAGTVGIGSSLFLANTASGEGGAISVSGEQAAINETTFTGNSGRSGGAVYTSGEMTVVDSELTNNQAIPAETGGMGGAVFQPSGRLTMRDTTVAGNQAGTGGAIAAGGDVMLSGVTVSHNTTAGVESDAAGAGLLAFGTATVVNSTFSGNSAASGSGGGVAVSGEGAATLNQVTIVENAAEAGAGGGIYNNSGILSIANSVVAFNTAASQAECANSTSLGYNLFRSADGCEPAPTDIAGDEEPLDPLLGALADNGGPTLTHLPFPGSPAIDAADPGSVIVELEAALANGQITAQESGVLPNPAGVLTNEPEAGSFFAARPDGSAFDLHKSFSTSFSFVLQPQQPLGDDAGGDGITFAVVPDQDFLGEAGGRLGIGTAGGNPSVAVEFDTFFNGFDEADPDGNHIGVDVGGISNGDAVLSIATATVPFPLDPPASPDGAATRWAWIDYSGATGQLSVFLANEPMKPTEPLLEAAVDIAATVGETGFFGFTGAGAAAWANQSVLSWEFEQSTCEPTDQRGELRPEGPSCDMGSVEVSGEPPPVTAAALLVDANTTEPGVIDVPLLDVPIERITGSGEVVEASPLASLPLASIPLASIDLAASPLASIPLASIPLASISVEGSPLASIPLASIPLASIGGWSALLADGPFENTPLQAVTLADLDPAVLGDLTLGDVTVAGSPLASISLPSLSLGSATVSQIDTSQNLCTLPALAGFDCQPDSTTLLDLEVQGAPLASIPLASIPLASIDLAATPLASIPLASIPLASIPLASIPLASIQVEGTPLASVPLASITPGSTPLASLDLLAAPLASIPLASIPLASIPLASIEVEGQPFCDFLSTVDPATSCSALGLDEASDGLTELVSALAAALPGATVAGSPLASIPLASIDLRTVPLSSIPLASTDLTGTPLASLPLASIDLEGTDFCAFLGTDPAGSLWCSTLGIDGTEALLDLVLALEAAGSTIDATPLASIPLASLALDSVPLASIDLTATTLAGTPLASIPLASLNLAGSPLASIPLASLGHLVTCDVLSACPTLGEAAALGALVPGAVVGDLEGVLGTTTFGDLVDALTLAFLLGAGTLGDTDDIGNLTFGQLLMSMLLASDYPWEELDLDALGVQEFSADNYVQYTVEFVLGASGPPHATLVDVTLPREFFYVTGSAELTDGSAPARAVPDPSVSDNADDSLSLTFDAGELVPGIDHRLSFSAVPPLRLGTYSATGRVQASGLPPEDADASAASVSVVEATSTDADSPAAGAGAEPDVLYLGHITSADDIDYFQIDAPPAGYRVAVFLSNLNSDSDLVMYRPVTAPVAGQRSVPLGVLPIEDDGLDFATNGTVEPDTLADIDLLAAPLASISTNRGTTSESASALSAADPFTIQVSGYNGDTSDEPYVLRVKVAPEVPTPQCSPRAFPFPVPPGGPDPIAIEDGSLPNDLNTLYLVNWERLAATEGTDPATGELYADQILTALVGSPSDPTGTPGLVDRPDLGISGLVVPVEHLAEYDAWDSNPCDPAAANSIADQIGQAVSAIADLRPSLRYVALVGSDEVIPLVRKPDLTSIANESTFTSDFSDNALYGSAITRHYLSDDPYGDLDPIPWLDRYLNVPDLAVGRLIETGTDILGAIETFNQFGGALDPQTALTTGYDFLYDGSLAIDDALSAVVPSTQALLDDVGVDPALAWGLTELRAALGIERPGPSLPDVGALSMHYDFDEALPSKGDATGDSINDLFDVTQIEGIDQAGSLYFTAGCHAGLSVADVAVGQGLPSRDWAQAYAENGAVYAAPTGYGYGDTVTVALTERLMAHFAENLDGSLSIGQALTFAKQSYFGDLGLYGVYDEKALQEAVFYGLPMYRIGSVNPPAAPSPLATTTDPSSGLTVAAVSVEPAITQTSTVNGELFSAAGATQFVHYRPIQPIVRTDVTQPGLIAHGALLTGLMTQDVLDVDIAYGRPIIDSSVIEPEVEADEIVFPTAFASVNLYNAPPGPATEGPVEERQALNVIAGQFTSPADGLTTGTQRLLTAFDAEVFYADPTDDDFTAPQLKLIQAALVGQHATFSVTTTDDGEADGVRRVVALYRSAIEGDDAIWTSVDLVQSGDTWTGGGPLESTALIDGTLDYLVQAVDAAGNVGVSTFKGSYHVAAELPPPPTGDPNEPGIQVEIGGTQGDNGWYLDETTVVVAETGDVTYEYSVNGSAFQPVPDGGIVVTREGVNIIVIRGSDGSQVVFAILIDTQPPTIAIQSPVHGSIVEPGATAEFTCADSGSGVTSCAGSVDSGAALPTVFGEAYLSVEASDQSGRTATASSSYFMVDSLVVDGPAEPIAPGETARLSARIVDTPYVEQALWDWESDGIVDEVCSEEQTDTCSISPPDADGRRDIVGLHTYDEPGVYTVTLSVDYGGQYTQTETSAPVVVTDPGAGFVTGAGFFESPSGAFTPDDPTVEPVSGEARFGFVARYRKSQPILTGRVHFALPGLELKSDTHEWLVVSDYRAVFQGTGRLSGDERAYEYRVTVIDGDRIDETTPDGFRIQIWYEASDASGATTTHVLYDNGFGADSSLGDGGTTPIGGGAIVIHTPLSAGVLSASG